MPAKFERVMTVGLSSISNLFHNSIPDAARRCCCILGQGQPCVGGCGSPDPHVAATSAGAGPPGTGVEKTVVAVQLALVMICEVRLNFGGKGILMHVLFLSKKT